MSPLIGPDVSFYEDDPETPQGIDYIKMRKVAGYVIIRAGQNLWTDRIFKTTWADAKAAGLPRGSYWFYDSRADPKRQAELYAQIHDGDYGELPLFADFEESYKGQYAGWRKWFDFLERLKELVGTKEIGIYTSYYYWRENAPSALLQPASLEYFHKYPLWIAHYGVPAPLVPNPWGKNEWLFWQYSESGDGKAYGAESNSIDLNYFNGELEAFQQRFNLTTTDPPVEPPADPGTIDQTGLKYKVNVSVLNVRSGPGITYEKVGALLKDEIVDAIAANADKTWIKISKGTALVGWCFAQYLTLTTTSNEPPADENIDQTGLKYKVTASALSVRTGPATTYEKIGTLQQNEVVDAILANADKSWIKIKKGDSLTGWCSAQYLTLVVEVEPPPIPEPSQDVTWNRVTTSVLNVRKGPDTTFEVVGILQQDDIVAAVAETPDKAWIQIKKLNGLTGWCSGRYLLNLGKDTPATLKQVLFTGVTYYQKQRTQPRSMISHVILIDMTKAGPQFLVTPPLRQSGPPLCTQKTSQFLTQYNLHIAINGDGFYYQDPATYNPQQYCPNGGDPLWPNGFAASRGKQYSKKKAGAPILYISVTNQITFNEQKGKIYNAISGDRMLVVKGKAVSGLENTRLDPRTAIGINQNMRWLVLAVVDGREASAGATFAELASLLISYGVYTGMSLDGGGSSTLVLAGADKQAVILNTPVDDNTAGHERAVANHLGIFFKK